MDKAKLLAKRGRTGEVEIEGVGVLKVRGLTREEMLNANTDLPVLLMERRMLATALIDPRLTEDEVAEWQASSPAGEITPVVEKINQLSAITKGADKEAYKSI